jgi:hypothetical protein
MKKSTIIFDNAGGTILKLYQGTQVYCHHYMYVEQATQDYYTFMTDTDLTDWEGHEEELVDWYPDYEDTKNGGYYVLDGEDLEKAFTEEKEYFFGYNHENFIEEVRRLKFSQSKEDEGTMNSELTELKAKYEELKDDLILKKANGSLSKLANLRSTFDETFDSFFDRKELRIKYNAWNHEQDEPNFDLSNTDLEKLLDDTDKEALCKFYENCIGKLEDELEDGE